MKQYAHWCQLRFPRNSVGLYRENHAGKVSIIRRSGDQLFADRIVSDFGVIVHVHFIKNSRAIRADCLNTEIKILCDIGDRFA